MFRSTRSTAWQSIWLCLAFLVLSLAMPSKAFAFNWNECVAPTPLAFSEPSSTPLLVETGGGTHTDGDGNTCDAFDRGLFPTSSSEAAYLHSFTTTSANGVAVTFSFLTCNLDTNPLPGTGGCLPTGAATLDTYYAISLGATSETTDSVTVYMDPTHSGTPSQAITIPLTITQPLLGFDWNKCVAPSPLVFASATATPTLIETGGGVNMDSDSNPCDTFDLGLFPTNDSEATIFSDFTATSANGVTVTFTYLACNFDLDPTPGTGGCDTGGAGSLNTYYSVSLSATTETADSVTVYVDPEQTGTPSEAIVIPLTIDQGDGPLAVRRAKSAPMRQASAR